MMPSTSGIVAADPNSRLSLELVARQDSSESIAAAHTDLSASGLDQYKRRPLLIVGQKLKTMADLVPFLQAVSRWTFESMMTTADHFHDPFPRANDGLFMGSTTTSTAMTTGGATAQLSALNVRTVDVPFIEDQLERDFALASDRGPHLTTGGLRVSTGGSGSSMNSAAIPASATTEDAAEHAMRLIDHQL